VRIGAILGLLSWLPVRLASGDARLASAVAVAILAAGTVANGIGVLVPWLLMRLGYDPTYGTEPGSTVVQDGCTILVYCVARAFGV
jgi:magnesium transporter